jgi:hypothetical protein
MPQTVVYTYKLLLILSAMYDTVWTLTTQIIGWVETVHAWCSVITASDSAIFYQWCHLNGLVGLRELTLRRSYDT